MSKKLYTIDWKDLVSKTVSIEAESKEEALQIFNDREYDDKWIVESECQQYDDAEITEEEE